MKFLRKNGARGTRVEAGVALAALALCGCARDDWRYYAHDAAGDAAEASTDVVEASADVAEASTDVANDRSDAPADVAADLPLDAPTDRADASKDVTSDVDCDRMHLLCDGRCINPQTDSSHCGMCNHLCGPAESCMSGRCMGSMPGCSADVCGGICVGDRCSQPLALSVGSGHVCARFDSTQVRCWGSNASGQLGRASVGRAETSPALVVGVGAADVSLSPVQQVSAGTTHTCAALDPGSMDTFGNVRCWGSNAARQLGQVTGDTFNRPAITGVTNVTAVASGARHTCALRVFGTGISVFCWGDNTQGQVGTGVVDTTVVTPSETPLNSLMASPSLGVVAGAQHTCAWDSTSVFCWGDNTTLALGRSMGRFNVPGLVDMLPGTVAKVVAGEGFTCANFARGLTNTVWCWGAAANGRNGLPTAVDVATPTMVPGLSGVNDIAAGRAHACALLNTGAVICWGDNRRGQLGVATPMESRSPLPLASMLRFTAIAAGGDTTCGLVLASRAVVCWGDNSSGQLGIPTTTMSQHLPQRVMF